MSKYRRLHQCKTNQSGSRSQNFNIRATNSTLIVTSAKVVEGSVACTDNSISQGYSYSDNQTTRSTFYPLVQIIYLDSKLSNNKAILKSWPRLVWGWVTQFHRINLYPMCSAARIVGTYLPDSDLSARWIALSAFRTTEACRVYVQRVPLRISFNSHIHSNRCSSTFIT